MPSPGAAYEVVDADAQLVVQGLTHTMIFCAEKYSLRVGAGCRVYYTHVVPKAEQLSKAVFVDAHRAPMCASKKLMSTFARNVMRKYGKQMLFIAGNASALAVPQSLFEYARDRAGGQVISRGVRPLPQHHFRVGTLGAAMAVVDKAKLAGATWRLLVPDKHARRQVMEFLRGGEHVVCEGDPVWLWRERARDVLHGNALGNVDLRKRSHLLLRTRTHGRIRRHDINSALVDTPATVGAAPCNLSVVLLGVAPALVAGLARSTTTAIIGVGFLPRV